MYDRGESTAGLGGGAEAAREDRAHHLAIYVFLCFFTFKFFVFDVKFSLTD